MGKSTISMAIFNSYVNLPEGIPLAIRVPEKEKNSNKFFQDVNNHASLILFQLSLFSGPISRVAVAHCTYATTAGTLVYTYLCSGVGKCPILGILDITL